MPSVPCGESRRDGKAGQEDGLDGGARVVRFGGSEQGKARQGPAPRRVAVTCALAAFLLPVLLSGTLSAQPVPPLPPPPPAPPPLQGSPALVTQLGQPSVEVTTAFAGTDVLVFGATERPIGPSGDNVIVVGQDPAQSQVVRRRTRVLGAWINGRSARFDDVPSWYALTGTEPLRSLLGQDERRALQLGLNALARRVQGSSDPDFRQALVDRKVAADLWQEDKAPVQVSGGRLFHARLSLPSIVPPGSYFVQVLLVREGRVVARQELPFEVRRVGTAAEITTVSHEQPLLYGLACIALAAFAGWIGSVIFRR